MTAGPQAPIRVLSLINGLGTGGAERSLVELDRPLRNLGIDVVYACFYERAAGVQQSFQATGAQIHRIRSSGWMSRVRETRALMRLVRPDLLHTTLFEADVVGRIAAAGTRIPVLTSLVNTSYDPVRMLDPRVSRVKLALARFIDATTARLLGTHYHAITSAVKESAVHGLGLADRRVTVIHRGRDPSRLGKPTAERRRSARHALGISARTPVIVNIGRQEFQKGQTVLLAAFGQVVKSLPEALLLIAGREGNATGEISRVVSELGAGGRVQLLGHRDDVPEILAAADVFAFPSLYEGLGGAVIEAMALGLPIVASDLPALREIVEPGRSAELVPAGESDALASALQTMLADPARQLRAGRRGREIFLERFTLALCAEKTARLYRAVVSGSPMACDPEPARPLASEG